MKCPHCLISFHDKPEYIDIEKNVNEEWLISKSRCPECLKLIIYLIDGKIVSNQIEFISHFSSSRKKYLVYPKSISRSPISPDIPNQYSDDYKEASLILQDSPKACAALCRRCLQNILRNKANIKPSNLYDEIQEIIDSKILPSQLNDAIDAVRIIGNFAAHPTKSLNTGEIVDVDPEEAEWSLNVLEALFDFFFIQPKILQDKKDKLNIKSICDQCDLKRRINNS